MHINLITFLADNSGVVTDVLRWVLPLVVTTIITGVVGALVKRALDKYFDAKTKEEGEIHQKLHELEMSKNKESQEQRKKDMIEIVKNEIGPINCKMDTLLDKVEKTEDGALASLRNDILTCYYRCCEKGYRGDWDFENIHHLYEAYAELHGNSFVKDVMIRFDELPTKEEFNSRNKNN